MIEAREVLSEREVHSNSDAEEADAEKSEHDCCDVTRNPLELKGVIRPARLHDQEDVRDVVKGRNNNASDV